MYTTRIIGRKSSTNFTERGERERNDRLEGRPSGVNERAQVKGGDGNGIRKLDTKKCEITQGSGG